VIRQLAGGRDEGKEYSAVGGDLSLAAGIVVMDIFGR
jgi:hypothetical protein